MSGFSSGHGSGIGDWGFRWWTFRARGIEGFPPMGKAGVELGPGWALGQVDLLTRQPAAKPEDVVLCHVQWWRFVLTDVRVRFRDRVRRGRRGCRSHHRLRILGRRSPRPGSARKWRTPPGVRACRPSVRMGNEASGINVQGCGVSDHQRTRRQIKAVPGRKIETATFGV